MKKTNFTVAALVATALGIGMLASDIRAATIVVDTCGYPFATGTTKQKTVFNESAVLRLGTTSGAGARIVAWYNDEHALTLGVRQRTVHTASGNTVTNFPVTASPVSVGDATATDPSSRPIFPVLFITDLGVPTGNTTTLACGGLTLPCPGDWQQQLDNSKGAVPGAVYGTSKAAVATINQTITPATTTITTDADPAKNNWNIPGAPDPLPSGLTNEGYGSEIVWNVSDLKVNSLGLLASNKYRLQFMVHDGDQNKSGGDVGEACVVVSGIGNACPLSDDTPNRFQLTGTPGNCVCPAGTDLADSSPYPKSGTTVGVCNATTI